MKKNREHNRRSLLAAILLAIATGPSWAGDVTQVDEQAYRAYLLEELRRDLKHSIDTLSLERADVVHRIAVQEADAAARARRENEAAVRPAWKSSGATL
jgi:hypothetical protein